MLLNGRVLVAVLSFVSASLLAFEPTTRADDGFDKTSDVTYVTRSDRDLLADVYVPRGAGPFPGVLMVHGGGWVGGSKFEMGGHARVVATRGYTVVVINYRLAPADKFPAQIEDCQEAVRWMRRNAAKYKIDPDRIAGYGYSAGGHLVCLLGATDPADVLEGNAAENDGASTRLQAVVAGGAPCDFRRLPDDSKSLAFFLGGTRHERPEVYRQASPASHVTKDDPPIFFFHGENDRLVPRASPERMMQLLRDAGVRAELYTIPGEGHIQAFLDRTAPEKAVEFLDEILKPAAKSVPAPLSGGDPGPGPIGPGRIGPGGP